MNGQERKYFNKMHSDLSHNMTELQARFEERWEAHDKSATERHKENIKKFDKIFEWLEHLPCKERKWLSAAVIGLYTIVGGVILAAARLWFLKQGIE